MSAAAVLNAVAERIQRQVAGGVLRVGIDGVDGAGKTTFADKLATALADRQLHVIRSSIDGFHNPRSIRYARGRDSAEGFYRDSFNLTLFRSLLLDPLSPGGTGRYRRAAFDHRTDSAVDLPYESAPAGAILVVDGIFLHRPELRDYWDISVFLDVPFSQSFPRMAVRDGSDPDPEAAANQRYRGGQLLYFAECDPRTSATVLIDYADFAEPKILRGVDPE
jgi:uridine kinase